MFVLHPEIHNKTCVTIVEDDMETAELYRNYINSKKDFCCPKIYPDAQSFLNDINNRLIPEILILDIGLPQISGNLAIPIILEETPDLKIIVLSVFADNDIMLQCFLNGAWAFESKGSSLVHFYRTLLTVDRGGFPLNRHLAQFLLKHHEAGNVSYEELEIKLLDEIGAGFSEEYIAQKFNLPELKINFLFKEVFEKFKSFRKNKNNAPA